MTLDEIEDSLPWGFHDAHLEGIDVDWCSAEVRFRLRVAMSESQDLDQRCMLIVNGLISCSTEPPRLSAPVTPSGLWVDLSPLEETTTAAVAARFYMQDWNSFVEFQGADARLEWVETSPQPSRSDVRASFLGDEIPD